jgi:hypothetical protein
MLTLNRSAIVVTPKEPFLDWIRGVDPSNRELTMADLENDPSVYLFPSFDFDHEIVDHLKESCFRSRRCCESRKYTRGDDFEFWHWSRWR